MWKPAGRSPTNYGLPCNWNGQIICTSVTFREKNLVRGRFGRVEVIFYRGTIAPLEKHISLDVQFQTDEQCSTLFLSDTHLYIQDAHRLN